MQSGIRFGPYEVITQIGSGGMGEVYRARDTRLGRDVAIKVLPAEFADDPERLRRFEQEARAIAALDHPNILAIHDVGTHEGSPYLVTELLEGESLRDRLRSRALPVRKAVETAVQIVQGLAAAHEKGIIHRDLKPENLFVTKEGHVTILDFGIAKLAPPHSSEELAKATTVVNATAAGVVLGTVAYMSPEQVRGQTVDQRSDIFSFGCVLYEMLSGRRAFGGETAADTMSAIMHEEPPGLESTVPGLPGPLCLIARRCLEKIPGDRFSSAHDLAFALEATGSSDSVVVAPPAVRRRRLLRIWIPSAALVAVAGAIFFIVRPNRPDSLPPSHTRQVSGELAMEGRAVISPNGAEIAYATKEDGRSAIWIADIRGGSSLRLTTTTADASDPGWFPDGGSIVFTSRDGLATTIWKVPHFGGAPTLLVPNAEQGAISPDGTRIAFSRRADEGLLRIWIGELVSLGGARRITDSWDGLFDHDSPAWSPDGKTICYSDMRDLWLVPAKGGGAHVLMKDGWVNSQPAWSADGRFIYFNSTREGTRALWRVRASGGGLTRVTDGTGSEQFPSFSRDGQRLAFMSGHPSGGIALADLRTGRVARIQGTGFSWLPAIAPDGSALVFVSKLADSVTLRSVPLRDGAPAGESVLLTDQPGTLSTPAFSPDGKWIAYYRVVEGQREVWIVPSTGGVSLNFSSRRGQDVQPAWSPDSSEIAFLSNRGGGYQIWVASFANGHRVGEPRQLTHDSGTPCFPSWSPDGKAIAYVLVTEAGREVWLVPADGSGPSHRLTSGAQAGSLRWFGTSAEILVSGYWGQPLPALRLLSPTSGGQRPFSLPGSLTLDRKVLDFDLSHDGHLLALFEGRTGRIIWVREADRGSF